MSYKKFPPDFDGLGIFLIALFVLLAVIAIIRIA